MNIPPKYSSIPDTTVISKGGITNDYSVFSKKTVLSKNWCFSAE
jgi:hypothetical protein